MKKAIWAGTLVVVAAIAVSGAFVVRSAFSADPAPLQPATTPDAAETTGEPSSTATAQDITTLPDFAPLETGTYYIEPTEPYNSGGSDKGASTPLRVVYDIAAEGWLQWIGATKGVEGTSNDHVGVSITIVTNLVRHGCSDHSPLDPPVGPTVDDLATALAELAPFRVTSPPTDVTVYGYRGKHLELTVPDLPAKSDSEGLSFSGCPGGNLESWISPHIEAFFGHTGPGYTEEFWILDVEGTRLVIVAHASPDAPADNLQERADILGSIRIQP